MCSFGVSSFKYKIKYYIILMFCTTAYCTSLMPLPFAQLDAIEAHTTARTGSTTAVQRTYSIQVVMCNTNVRNDSCELRSRCVE